MSSSGVQQAPTACMLHGRQGFPLNASGNDIEGAGGIFEMISTYLNRGTTIMRYHISPRGFEGHKIEVQSAGVFSGYKLIIDGERAPKGPKRGQMTMRRNDGAEVLAVWKPKVLGFDVPQLQVEGETIDLVQPLQWYEWLWGGLPILLLFVGGAIGGILGGVAFTLNAKVFRTESNLFLKFLFSGAISMLAVLTYLFIGFLLFAPAEPS